MADIAHVIGNYTPALNRLAASYERDPALREELVQEILLAVHQALPRLADPEKLKPFVFRIAHNRAVSHVAHQTRKPEPEAQRESLPPDSPDPEQQWDHRQRTERLLKAVRRLPLPYRQTITLLIEDLTYQEIGEALGISVSNVGVRVNRAKQLLKAMLNDDR